MNKPLKNSVKKRAVFEAKHTNAWADDAEIVQKYYPQLQHNMIVTGCDKAYLSVFFGNSKWQCFEIEADSDYQEKLIEAERDFWDCVQTGRAPVVINVPVPVEAVRKVDFTGNNEWASHADTWLKNKGYAKAFDESVKAIKSLIDADVQLAFGHGIKASRSKSGAITIRAEKSDDKTGETL
jgi:predicted phage-related endonuclease